MCVGQSSRKTAEEIWTGASGRYLSRYPLDLSFRMKTSFIQFRTIDLCWQAVVTCLL